MAEIDILLAAYNGEKYIAEQLDSIIGQDFSGWRLIVQDDCSSDGTFDILRGYAEKHREIQVCRREASSGSSKANFLDMLKYAEAPYIMFSDQDDLWLPEKISRTLSVMRELEKTAGTEVPLLVHGDLLVTDAELNVIHPSMFRYQGLNSRAKTLNKLFVQNNVTGCTMMINRALLQAAKKAAEADTEKILMHDWWFALIASAFGSIGFVDEALIKYRQHGDNQLGAVNNRNVSGIVNAVKVQNKTRGRISRTYAQADEFYRCYKDSMSADARRISEYYLSVPEKSKPGRVFALISHGHLKQNFVSAVGQLIFC